MHFHFDVFIFLNILVAIEADGMQGHDCTHNEKTYVHLEEILHANGCAVLQCQFGRLVTFYEACDKEVDGSCHRLNFMFEHKGRTFQCRKVGDEYKNEIAIARNEACTDGGKRYQTLEKFHRGDDCREYQCHNGEVVALDPACGREVDGKCHLVGELFEKNGTVYNCTGRVVGEDTVYENIAVGPPSTDKVLDCTTSNYSYKNYEILTILPLCHLRQCQTRRVKIISQACAFKKETIQCYEIGEQWQSDNNTYQCTYDAKEQKVAVEILTRGYAKCKRGEHWYNHLEVHTRLDGCTSVQCQDGRTSPVEEGCLWKEDNQCHDLNFVWKSEKSTTHKCILTEDGLYRTVELDKDGHIIEQVDPTDVTPHYVEHCSNLAADIIFVLDSSQSIVSTEFERTLNFSAIFAKGFKIGPKNVRFAAVVFSDKAVKVFDLKDYDNYESLEKAILNIPFLADTTNTDKALRLIVEKEMFGPENGGRDFAPNLVVLITDGNSTKPDLTLGAASDLKERDVDIIVIPVGNINEREIYGIASSSSNVFSITSFEDIFTLISKLSERTCEVIVPAERFCISTVADLYFLLDSSAGVGTENFDLKIKEAIRIIKEFVISPQRVQVGAALISSAIPKLFDLNKYSDEASVVQALEAAPYLPSNRDTALGLELVLDDGLFTSIHGARENVTKILFIIIDGPSEDSAAAIAVAQKLRESGAVIFVIGIDNYKEEELVGLAGSSDNVFTAYSYSEFNHQRSKLISKLCEVNGRATPEPEITTPEPTIEVPVAEKPKCLSGEENQCQHICTDTEDGFKCSCKIGYVENSQDSSKCDVIPCTEHALADIIFIVDSSDSVGIENYVKTFDFLYDVVASLPIGENDVHVGAIIYSWDVVQLFKLNTYYKKADINKALHSAPYLKSSTYTHKALSFINSTDMFSTESGGRENAPKLVILLTDGKSAYKKLTLTYADILKAKDIKIIAIGVSKAIDSKELKAVASRPEDFFFAATFNALEEIKADVVKITCTVINPE